MMLYKNSSENQLPNIIRNDAVQAVLAIFLVHISCNKTGCLCTISLGIPRELKFRGNQYMTNQGNRVQQ
jgi:hypothetical protein